MVIRNERDTLKNSMSKRYLLLLFLIFIFAIAVRFIHLSQYPAGFQSDEASVGYNAYSLLLTGKDDNGIKLPLYIDIFGDYRLAGIHYLAILPVKFLGLNEFSTRFFAAFLGALTVIPFYFLAYGIYQNKKIAILSSLVLALTPWSIVFSRATSDGVVAVFFIIFGFAFFTYAMRNNNNILYFISVIILSTSFFFYHTPRIFVPLLFFFITGYLFVSERKRHGDFLKVALVFLSLTIISFSSIFFIKGGTNRFNQVNIFSSFEANFQLQREIQEDSIAGSNKFVSRFIHNKATNIMYMFTTNYLDYFSGNFLFLKGGLPLWYLIPRAGVLHVAEFPFLLYGIYCLIIRKKWMDKIPLVWMFVAPIVPAITIDDIPNVQRSMVMFPMLDFISVAGFIFFLEKIPKNRQSVVVAVIAIAFFLNVGYFLHQYFFNATVEKPWYRNNGFGEMMQNVKKSYASYDKIIITKYQGATYPLVLFYMQYDPQKYQMEGSPKAKDYGGFGKFLFAPQDCPSVQTSSKTPKVNNILYVDKGDCPMDKSLAQKKIKYVYREDGTKAFRVVY